MVKANVDRILDELKQNKSVSISKLASGLKLKKEDIQKSAEYLEQDGIIKIEHKWPKVVLTLVKDETTQGKEGLPTPPAQEAKEEPKEQLKVEQPKQDQPLPPMQAPLNRNIQNQSPSLNQQGAPTAPQASIQLQAQNITLVQGQPGQLPTAPVAPVSTQSPSPQVSAVINNPNLPPPPRPQSLIQSHTKLPQPIVQKNTNLDYANTPMHELLKSSRPAPLNINDEINRTQNSSEFDPLNPDKPHFDMAIPEPGNNSTTPVFMTNDSSFAKPTQTPVVTSNIPTNVSKDTEKIEYLLDKLNFKLNNQDYSNINTFYRNIYKLFLESEQISPNERYLLSEKINEIFDRIKHTYVIEGIV